MTPDFTLRTRTTRGHPGRPAGDRQRRLLLALVAADPGVHVRRAASILGLNWNACWHHVRRLERTGEIVVRRHGGRLCLFERQSGASNPRILRLMVLEPRNAALVERVLDQPGANQSRLARELDLAASVVHRRLVRLEAAGLIQRSVRPREMLVFPTQALEAAWATRDQGLPAAPFEHVAVPQVAEGPAAQWASVEVDADAVTAFA